MLLLLVDTRSKAVRSVYEELKKLTVYKQTCFMVLHAYVWSKINWYTNYNKRVCKRQQQILVKAAGYYLLKLKQVMGGLGLKFLVSCSL